MRLLPLTVIYFVSGTAALVYEVAWNRMLSSTLGAASYTLAILLAAYMAGLALGSRVFGEVADRTHSPLRLYAWLEIGIAVWALAVPALMTAVQIVQRWAYPMLSDHLSLLLALRLGLAFLILLVPTTLMGGTYPALGRAGAIEGTVGSCAAILYAANTLGAMAGATWAGFDGIARLGVRGTTQAAALASLAAGLAGLILAGRFRVPPPVPMEPAPRAATGSARALALVALTGFSTLALEVVWTRLLVTVVASTTYAFSALLAVFLAGIALGSALVTRLVPRVRSPVRVLGLLAALTGIAAVGALAAMGQLATPAGVIGRALGSIGWHQYIARLFWDALRLAFPATLLSGAMIPFAAEVLSRAGSPPGRALARVYAWNTFGAMIGPPVAAFVLIPFIGNFARVILLLGALLVLGSLLGGGRAVAAALAAALLAISWVPDFSTPVAIRHRLYEGGRLVYYREGSTCTVAVVEHGASGDASLFTDSFEMAGVGEGYSYMRVLGHLPMLLAPGSRNAAVIGFGTGTSAAALSMHSLDTLDIIEISRDVTDASGLLQAGNHGILQRPPPRPRVRVIYEDGKTWLDTTTERYDVIVSEPPLPTLAGTANLFSIEFYASVRRCLRPGGVYVQWLPIHGMSPGDCPGLVRSFLDVFPGGLASFYRQTVFLVQCPSPIEAEAIAAAAARERVQPELVALGFARVEDVLGSFFLDGRDLERYAGDAPAVTDDRPWVEFFDPDRRMPRAFEENLAEMLRAVQLGNLQVDGVTPDIAQNSRRSVLLSMQALLAKLTAERLSGFERRLELEHSASLADEALRRDPGNVSARALLGALRPSLNE